MKFDDIVDIEEAKNKRDTYLKQRAFVIDKKGKNKIIIGLAPWDIVQQYLGEGTAQMAWFADVNGRTLAAGTLEGLFRELKKMGAIEFVPFMPDWRKMEERMKKRVAVGGSPYGSIKEFAGFRG